MSDDVALTLTPYQVSNLHNALRLIYREAPCDLPVRALNNGDWCGELFWLLDGKVTVPPNPVWGEVRTCTCPRCCQVPPGRCQESPPMQTHSFDGCPSCSHGDDQHRWGRERHWCKTCRWWCSPVPQKGDPVAGAADA